METIIKGLNQFHQYELNGIHYYFLGDLHINTNTCDYQCDHMTNQFTELVVKDTNCTDITAFIYKWLNYNFNHQIITNFYIEHAISKDRLTYQYDDYTGTSYSKQGYMQDTIIMLQDCLMGNCPYNPVIKVHNIDPRNIIVNGKRLSASPFLLDDIYNRFYAGKTILNKKYNSEDVIPIIRNLSKQLTVFIKLIYFLIGQSQFLLGIVFLPNYEKLINVFINKLSIFEPGLVKNDMMNIINNMLLQSKIRNNVKVHPIYAQLSKINGKLANKIKSFILERNKYNAKILLEPAVFLDTMERNDFSITYDISIINDWIKQSNTNTDMGDLIVYFDKVLESISNIVNKVVILSAPYQDAYLLGRLFKYNQDEAIVYAGSNHVDVYSDFFKEIGATNILTLNSDTCLHIVSDRVNEIRK